MIKLKKRKSIKLPQEFNLCALVDFKLTYIEVLGANGGLLALRDWKALNEWFEIVTD